MTTINSVFIQSKDRASTDNIYDFNVRLRNVHGVRRIKFKQLAMHNSMLPFGNIARNNTIYWLVGATDYSATVNTPNSWTGTDLATVLQTALNSTGGGGYTVTYSSVTMKFTIANAAAFSLRFSQADASDALYNVYGFAKGVDVGPSTSITSTNMAKCQGFSAFYLASRALTRSKAFYSGMTASTQGTATNLINSMQNVFMMIPVDVGLGELIKIVECDLTISQFNSDQVLENIDIQVVDEYGQPITLEAEWNFTIDLEQVRGD